MDNLNLKILGMLVIVFLVATGDVLALGVSSAYHENNPLKIYPGETKEVAFTLVNGESYLEEVVVSLKEGSEIASIISGEKYRVIPLSNDVKIILRINIPEDANLGEEYSVGFTVIPDSKEEQGTVQFGIGYNIIFPVKIISEPMKAIAAKEDKKDLRTTINIIITLIITILIIVAIISYKWIARKKRHSQK